MSKQVCILGGGGFLGSHVADALTSQGYKVRIFDIKKSPWINGDQEMICGDLLEVSQLENAIKGCEIVYNFAALSDLNEAINKPIETVKINILGNVNALDLCVKHKVKRFIYASSVYVYGREGGFYRCSKHAAEQYIEEYQKMYGLNFTILRYGSLYGPRSDISNGLFRMVKNVLEAKEILYEGDIEAVREYIHVEDAALASVNALNPEFNNECIVLTGQQNMRVVDLLEMLVEIIGLEDHKIKIIDGKQAGHYTRTPYAYKPKIDKKYTLPLHVDLGRGLMQMIEIVKSQSILDA